MSNKDLNTLINLDYAIGPVVATNNTAQTGEIIDTLGYESLSFGIIVGTIADTDATLTPSLEHGDNSSLTDSAVPGTDDMISTIALNTFAADDDNHVRWLGYVGKKRYVRLTLTPASNTGNLPMAAIAIKGHPLTAPTSVDS